MHYFASVRHSLNFGSGRTVGSYSSHTNCPGIPWASEGNCDRSPLTNRFLPTANFSPIWNLEEKEKIKHERWESSDFSFSWVLVEVSDGWRNILFCLLLEMFFLILVPSSEIIHLWAQHWNFVLFHVLSTASFIGHDLLLKKRTQNLPVIPAHLTHLSTL